MKNYSPAFERNHQPITDSLRVVLPSHGDVIEIGSGSGQHIAWFAKMFPNLRWQPTDLDCNLDSIASWCNDSNLTNTLAPIAIDLNNNDWPNAIVDVLICINTIHIVSWKCVQNLFEQGARHLKNGGRFFVYGPYEYSDRALEPSNVQFNLWLKQQNINSGIRLFDSVNQLAESNSLKLISDRSMPSNNRAIFWEKVV